MDVVLCQLAGVNPLKGLLLDDTKITDDDLLHLEHLTRVQWLSLEGTPITDAGLKHLTSLTRLEWLGLKRTQVTDAGVKKLQQALPNCKIERDNRPSPPF
jgi:hypothetical protein